MAEIFREGNLWHLRNEWISYALMEMPGGVLAHLYAGPRLERLNPASLQVCRGVAEKVLAEAETGASFQFLRTGYFCKDPDSTPELPVYNRTVGLRDTFAKQQAK